jgi:hypothetical protein
MKAHSAKPVRCAIYTRVSTDQGLDQEFNSLDAQYDASSAYIKSQAHAGWTLIRSRYDDGGYRRDHLRALAQRVEVADHEVRIMGSKSDLLKTLAAISCVKSAAGGVRSSVLDWRRERDSNP